jgi:hypothetical protein
VGGVFAQVYADDICILAVGNFPNTVSGLIQRALQTVEEWCGGLGLSVNPEKTGLVALQGKGVSSSFFEPKLFGGTLHRAESVKYLGVILDVRLTWKNM